MIRLCFLFFVLFSSCSKPLLQKGRAIVVNGRSNSLQFLDIKNLNIEKTIHLKVDSGYFANKISISPSEKYICLAFPNYDFSQGHEGLHNVEKPGKVLIVNTVRMEEKWLEVPKANYNAIFNISETEVWTAGYSHSGRIYVYDLLSGKLKKEIIVESDPSQLLLCKKGEYIAVACGESSFVSFINTETYKLVKDVKVDPYPHLLLPGFGNKIIVINERQKSLNFIDVEKLKAVEFIDLDFIPSFASYNLKTDEMWVSSKSTPEVHIYKLNASDKWEKKEKIFTEYPLYKFAFYNNFKSLLGISQADNKLIAIATDLFKVFNRKSPGSSPNDIIIQEK